MGKDLDRMLAVSNHFKRFPLWAYISLLAVITYYTWDISIVADMTWYLNSALNIFTGKGYTDMAGASILNRGPVFPLLISLSYWIMGVSPWSAFWVVRIFCILNPLLIYLIGKHFWGRRVGFIAAILLLTSYNIGYWSYRHVDAVWVTFVLAANYFFFLGFDRHKIAFFISGGCCLGLAILTKEVAILFLPLPLLMHLWIKTYRTKRLFFYVVTGFGMTLLCLLPWIYHLIENDNLQLFIGKASPLVIKAFQGSAEKTIDNEGPGVLKNIYALIKQFGFGLWQFYTQGRNSLHHNFMLAPGFCAAWVLLLLKSLHGDRSAKIIISNAVLFSPILSFLGISGWRLGQSIIFLLLSYLALSFMLVWLYEKISRNFHIPEQFCRPAFYAALGSLIFLQTFIEYKNDRSFKFFLNNSFFYNLVFGGEKERRISNYFDNKQLALAIERLGKTASADEGILVDWYYSARTAYFKLNGQRQVYEMPVIWCSAGGFVVGKSPESANEKPIFLTSNNRPLERQFYLFMLFESQLIKKIEENNIKHILITRGFWQLHRYFHTSPFFEESFVTGSPSRPHKMCRIYRVVGLGKNDSDRLPIITDTAKKNLIILKQAKPPVYALFLNKYLFDLASFTTSDLAKLGLAR